VCRYDYQTQAPGPPPVVVESATPAPEPVATPAPEPAAPPVPTGHAEWEVTITVDPSLDSEPDPEAPPPPDVGDRIFPIDLPEMLVGRRDDAHHIRPEIPVIDPSVSRRHAHFLRLPEGRVAIVDLASANGTAVNGTGLVAGQRRELADGDVVTIGRWTRITVSRRGQVRA
jgi:FHA domain